MRDRAFVNYVVIRTTKIIYQHSLDIGWFSHTQDVVDDHFKFPNLMEFVSLWLALFSHRTKTKFLCKEYTGCYGHLWPYSGFSTSCNFVQKA